MTSEVLDRMVIGLVCLSVCLGLVALVAIYASMPSPRRAVAPACVDAPIHAVHTGGDHRIVVGRVNALGTADGADEAPLLFHRGRFR